MTTSRALVTGASQGVGLEVARQLAKRGYDVVLTAEDDALESAAARTRAYGTRVKSVRLDLRREEGVEELLHRVPEDLVDVLVGTATAFDATPAGAGGPAAVDPGVRSAVRLAERVLLSMLARGSGKVLFALPVAEAVPESRRGDHRATEAFLLASADRLRAAAGEQGVSVTVVRPEPQDTALAVARRGCEALVRGEAEVLPG
ncbi:SDR family NAD(P)-dependent oxidoreductase [Amycolatopsis sp. PS_44_ISF1]|uniref:SDR family NAD(P)-dependent oxidoreductase n=1 Tax=Amycolatopsis sp. PS_44_ISF1 TaxID=2974917 RepID=UPI0028DDE12F|nr:SDR family NAD(P)-dependent oxidoreductase [Amycolatopsis sp. PS_44_ISF1]MDT8912989.1 SDR family NAD(P)-dependent oxidoreductase [Amycolatopsis sp. PS_44_ISF1]